MKTQRTPLLKRGFTLMELMVAMAITTIIVTVLVSITSIAIDTWNRSRSELRAARQAKAMVDTMSRDFESLVTRTGNANEWLSAVANSPGDSSNASTLVFFTAATDRYNGEISGPDQVAGNADDPAGGDVSCVGYKLDWKDPIQGGASSDFQTFVLNRYLVNPDETFNNLLGQTNIGSLFTSTYGNELSKPEYFICENVFQFTVTFHVQVTDSASSPPVINVPVTLGDSTKDFRILGTGISTDYSGKHASLVPAGRISAVEISLTVLSDAGVDLLRKSPARASDAKWLAKNSYQYSKLIQLPGN